MPVGKIQPFRPGQDDVETWLEVVKGYFLANDVNPSAAEHEKKCVATLIASMGLDTYSLLRSLLSPRDPSGEKWDVHPHQPLQTRP